MRLVSAISGSLPRLHRSINNWGGDVVTRARNLDHPQGWTKLRPPRTIPLEAERGQIAPSPQHEKPRAMADESPRSRQPADLGGYAGILQPKGPVERMEPRARGAHPTLPQCHPRLIGSIWIRTDPLREGLDMRDSLVIAFAAYVTALGLRKRHP